MLVCCLFNLPVCLLQGIFTNKRFARGLVVMMAQHPTPGPAPPPPQTPEHTPVNYSTTLPARVSLLLDTNLKSHVLTRRTFCSWTILWS